MKKAFNEEEQDDVYSDEAIEEKLEDDEIDELEEGFMKGYNQEEKVGECANCGQILTEEDIIEEEINGKSYQFCCEECASEFEERKKH